MKLLRKKLVLDMKNCSKGLEAIAIAVVTVATTVIIAASKHDVGVNTAKTNIILVW